MLNLFTIIGQIFIRKRKNNMKNKISKFIISSICLLFVLFGNIFTGKAEQKCSASALSFSNVQNQTISSAENQETTTENKMTPFLIDPTNIFLSSSNVLGNETEYLYVFDNEDSLLKVIDKETGDFRAENTSYQTNFSPTGIISIDELLLLYDVNDGQIQTACISQNDFTEFEVEETFKQKLLNANKILVVEISTIPYVLICPSNPTENNFELISFEKIQTEEQKVLKTKETISFKISIDFADNVSDYDHIYACENNEKLFVMIVKGDNIVSFEYDLSVKKSSVNSIQSPSPESERFSTSEIIDFCEISLTDSKIVAILLENKIEFYSFSISSGDIVLAHIQDQDLDFSGDENFLISNFCAFENTLAVLSSEKQQINTYTFSCDLSNLQKQEKIIKNKDVSPLLWENSDDFLYVKATADTKILSAPFSKDTLATINLNQTMVIVGEGYIGEEKILGYSYVLFTSDDVNHLGYVKNSSIEELEKSTYSYSKVTVLTNTALLKYPTYIRNDGINSENGEMLKATADVWVSTTETGLYEYSCQGVKFLKVSVKESDGSSREGFIDISRARNRAEKATKVVTNASILKDNSEIFTEENSESEIITYLDEGARVKIIGKRNTKTNFTKVTFNDKAGNTHTGYVYTSNVKTDTWSMLQIFGMALIIINTILLVVIICVKNKVTK